MLDSELIFVFNYFGYCAVWNLLMSVFWCHLIIITLIIITLITRVAVLIFYGLH